MRAYRFRSRDGLKRGEVSIDAASDGLEAAEQTTKEQNVVGLRALHDEVFQSLAQRFANGQITGEQFQEQFFHWWRIYRDNHVATSEAVDQLFTALDCFCGDETLWDPEDLDEAGLRTQVDRFLGDHAD